MPAGMKMILVSSENVLLLRELLGKARRFADALEWQVAAAPLGGISHLSQAELSGYGMDILFQPDVEIHQDGNPEVELAILTGLIRQVQPQIVLIGATKLGMEVVPRLAERLDAGYAPWTVDFEVDPVAGTTLAKCMLYAGMGQAAYRLKSPLAILTAAQGVFQPQNDPGRETKVEVFSPAINKPRMTVVEHQPKGAGSSRLEEAKIVVDVGQGIKQREDLGIVQSVVDLLGAQLACSRPLSSDRDWFPEWLGLSGKKVKPELCLSVGVSGAVQHIVGIRESRVVIAVNKDESAGIFSQADYGVVVDLYEFLPALAERLKARGIQPVWQG